MEQGGRRETLAFLLASFVLARGQLPDFPMTYGDMKVKAGYYTEGGKYLGGIPKADPLSREIYECQEFYSVVNDSSNATACMEWRADESADGTLQLGSCECTSVTNDAYCSSWVCRQVKQVNKCYGGDCYVIVTTDNVMCTCDVENASGFFCDSWSCRQNDSEGRVESEQYHCQRNSSSGHYCEAWNGNVTAKDEIEVVTCQCVAEWNGERVCSYWECEELGLNMCASTGSWCSLGVSVGVGGVFGMFGIILICAVIWTGKQNYWSARVVLFGIVWCFLWSVGVVIWGGADGATYVGIMWGGSILLVSIATLARQRLDLGPSPTRQAISSSRLSRPSRGICIADVYPSTKCQSDA